MTNIIICTKQLLEGPNMYMHHHIIIRTTSLHIDVSWIGNNTPRDDMHMLLISILFLSSFQSHYIVYQKNATEQVICSIVEYIPFQPDMKLGNI
jgi:hypothetical protein